jgi:TolB-like protein
LKHCRCLLLALSLLVLIGLVLAPGSPAFGAPVRLALLSIENQSADPRFDYLEGIIRGVLLFDLSSQPGVEMITRTDLDAILREQELQVSGLAADPQAAARVGQLLGADYLVRGEYTALGGEVQVTVRLLEVAGGRTLSFVERGSSENLLHALAERVLQRLTGSQVALQSEQKERSILSLRDEKPGKISLHSFLIDAEIFLDEEFVGYTTGNERTPFVMEGVLPGRHRVRIHLQDFGVVKEPEISFHDWEQTVEVLPGKNHVLRSNARHFNDLIYRLQQLLREEIPREELARAPQVKRRHDASFTDRSGRRVPILFDLEARRRTGSLELRAVVRNDGEERVLSLTAGAEEDRELRQAIGLVDVVLSLDSGEISYEIWRNDIQQNMFR